MPNNSTPRTVAPNMTVLSVCVDRTTIASVLEVAETHRWSVTTLGFEEYISATRRPYINDQLKSTDGCLAIIDFDRNADHAEQTAIYLQQVFGSKISLLAVGNENTPGLLLRAMHCGCTGLLHKPCEDAEISEALRRIETQIVNRSASTGTAGSVLAFFGAKGGVGTTTIAIHLATFLVHNNNKKVLLIDAHAQFGHACIYLGVDGSGSNFQELVRNVNRLDSQLLRGFITTHATGLDILSSPELNQVARAMHPDDVASALDFLRMEYDLVIVDCSATLDEINRAIIEAASLIYVVATPEISAVRDLSRYVDELVRLTDTASKVKVVINRYSSQFAVSLAEIEKAIRLSVTYSIPNSFVELVRAANLGVPLQGDDPSGFATEIRRWADSLAGKNRGTQVNTESIGALQRSGKSLRAAVIRFLNPQISRSGAERRA